MPIRSLAAVLFVLLAGVRPASASFLVIGSNPTTELTVPFGTAGDGSSPSDRYQQVFAASLFRGPIAITALTFYAQGQGAGGVYNQVTYNFNLSTTTVSVGGLNSTNLAANVGSNVARFASVNPTGNAPSSWTIDGSTPFFYDPSRGNLLLDIQIVGQRVDAGFLGAGFDGQADFGGRSSSADNFGGNIASSGLSLGVTFNAVPEPSSLTLGLIGGALASVLLRRRATQSAHR